MPVYNILYLPEKINIGQLSQHKLFTAIPHFHADKLAYLIYIERYVRSLSPNSIKRNGYTKLYSKLLQSAVREYSQYYDAMEELRIMARDHNFSKELNYSFGYQLTEFYRSDSLKEYTLTLRVIRVKLRELAKIPSEVVKDFKHLTKWFNERLQIDVELAKQFYTIYRAYIKELSAKKWAASLKWQVTEEDKARYKLYYDEPVFQLYNVYRIAQGYYPISVDTTSYRMHTNLTILKSELRHALTYNNKQLVALDLSNSQPYFSLLLFNWQFWQRPLIFTGDIEQFRKTLSRFNAGTKQVGLIKAETPYNRNTSLHISQFRIIALYLGLVNGTQLEMQELAVRQQKRKANRSRNSSRGAVGAKAKVEEELIESSVGKERTITQQSFIIPLITLVDYLQSSVYEDVDRYFELVRTGYLYEHIDAVWKKAKLKSTKNRSELKASVFQALFTANQFKGQRDARPKEIFSDEFPNVAKVFEVIKKREPEQLPILLQSIESHLFLNVITKRIANERPNLPIFTIHDSIVTTVGNEDYVKQVMTEELLLAIGVEPTIKTEYYNSHTLKQIIAEKAVDLSELSASW